MRKIARVLIGWFLLSGAGVALLARHVPPEQAAHIEGFGYSELLGPYVKEHWPDLRSFSIAHVSGDDVDSVSKSEAVVGPGTYVVTLVVRTREHGSATLTLHFEAEPGGTYLVRPVYRGSAIHATIQNKDTGELVAQTWQSHVKRRREGSP